MNNYLQHLQKDSTLRKIISEQDSFTLQKKTDLFEFMCGTIISQQLSTKVADIIFDRFKKLHNRKKITPKITLSLTEKNLREAGLSFQKINYIKNVSEFFILHSKEIKQCHNLSNEELLHFFTQIKGIGVWSVQMLLMFCMQREDVLPHNDLGIQLAIAHWYKLDIKDKKTMKKHMEELEKKWSPYNTYAALHLWQWKDNGS